MTRKNWRNLSVDLALAIKGHRLTLTIIPFRFAKPSFRTRDPEKTISGERTYQAFLGPFHLWTMHTACVFEIELKVNFDGGYHGMSVSGYNPLRRWASKLMQRNTSEAS